MIEQFVRLWAQVMPEKFALTMGERSWTYQELDAVVQDLAAYLTTVLPVGAAFALLVTPEEEVVVAAVLAAERSGHPVVLLSPALSATELVGALTASRSSLLIVPSLAMEKANDITGLPRLTVAGSQFRHAPARVPDWAISKPIPPAHSDVLPADTFVCQLTSGSTGPSRLATRSKQGIAAEVRAISECLDLQQSDRVLCASSIAHSYGLVGGLLAPLSAGAHVILVPEQCRVPHIIDKLEPTIVLGLAATYRACLDQFTENRTLTESRFLLSAGAPLPDTLFTAFRQRFGSFIRQDYGTTETGTIAIDTSAEPVPGCVGVPLPHLAVRLGAPEGPATDAGRETEVLVRSIAVASGYLGNDHRVVPCVDGAGWYHTMDAGAVDQAGRLCLQGRFRALIWVKGHAISPVLVERVIGALPGVREVVVVGDKTALNRSPKAVVVAPGLDTETIRWWCERALPTAWVSKRIEQRTELPRSPAGKVLQKYL